MRRSQGFSLIEVVVATAILGVVLAMGVPALQEFLVNARIRGVTTELREGLQAARMEAIRRNSTVSIVSNGAGWEIRLGGLVSGAVVPGTLLRSKTGGAKDLALAYAFVSEAGASTALSASSSKVLSFRSDGRTDAATTAAGYFSISSTEANSCQADGGDFTCLRVVISSGGMIRSCNPNPAYTGKADGC